RGREAAIPVPGPKVIPVLDAVPVERERPPVPRVPAAAPPPPPARRSRPKVLLVTLAVLLPAMLMVVLVVWLVGMGQPIVRPNPRPQPSAIEPQKPIEPVAKEEFPKVLDEMRTSKNPPDTAILLAPPLTITPVNEEF